MTKYIQPGAKIGIIGGGQLGKMLAQSAKQMGYQVGILDPSANCSASQVADFHVQATFEDVQALEKFAQQVDVLTYEFENISLETLETIIKNGAYLPQGSEILRITQDRLTEKDFLKKAGIPVATYVAIETAAELDGAIKEIGYPAVIKTRRFGYDGKGQVMIKTEADLPDAKKLIDKASCVLEAFVPFDKEVSHMVVRNLTGQVSIFPLSENCHRHHILHQSIVPARVNETITEKALAVAKQVAESLNLIGIVGIEMFIIGDQVLVNELAPRPHNSGHYSIEACEFSQFDLHIRAICGMTLPINHLHSPVIMTNILGQHLEAVVAVWPDHPEWHLHLYNKGEARQDRKMGHITQLTNDLDPLIESYDQLDIWSK